MHGVKQESLPNNFPGWLYLGNLSFFPHFGHLKPSTLPASHWRSSAVGCTGPVATVLVPQFAQIGLSSQWKNLAENKDVLALIMQCFAVPDNINFYLRSIYLGGKFNK